MKASPNDDGQIFDTAVRDRLGLRRLPPERFNGGFGSIIRQVYADSIGGATGIAKKYQCQNWTTKILFGVTDSMDLNAYAFRYDSGDVRIVAINVGFLLRPLLVFSSLFSEPGFLPEVGNSDEEHADPKLPFDHQYQDACPLLGNATHGVYTPRDFRRLVAAESYTKMLASTINLHEFSHHMLGHVDYWGDRIGSPFINEMTPASGMAPDRLIRQMFEMEADANAMQNMMAWGFEVAENPASFGPGYGWLMPELEASVFHCGLTGYFLYKMLDTDKQNAPWESMSHPPPMLRLRMAMRELSGFLKKDRPEINVKLGDKLIPRIIEIGEGEFGPRLGIPPRTDRLKALTEDGAHYVDMLYAMHSNMEDCMKKFKFVSV